VLENKISAVITEESHKKALDAVKTIRETMPFLADLTTEERRRMLKLGDKSVSFVGKAMELAIQNPDFLPRNFDIDEMKKDVELYLKISGISQAVTQLAELIDDTTMQAGSEAYSAALVVYQYAKNSRIRSDGLDELVDDMGKLFVRKSAKTDQP
jgi:hypothetical protein